MTPAQREAALRLADELDQLPLVPWCQPAKAAALLRELAAAPQRPPTLVGWSDTDWLAHLSTMPPIAYAVRDTLYGTSKAGVLRFCAADEPGAFAVYAHPPQRQPLSEFQRIKIIGDEFPLALVEPIVIAKIDSVCRAVERAHGIGETP